MSISNERKLFIHICLGAFKTDNEEMAEKWADKVVKQLNEEELEYAIKVMDGYKKRMRS